MSAGTHLRRWASRVCSARTMECLIDPVIADLQHEHEHANGCGQTWHRCVALLRGYFAFWRVLALHVPRLWLNRMVQLALAERRAIGRALFAAAVTMTLVTASLLAAPAHAMARRDSLALWLLVLLLPQSVPFSLPLGLSMGVVYGLRGRTATFQIRRLVIALGLGGSLVSASTMVWVVPEANQAYRTIIAGHVILRGPAEMPLLALRGQALALRSHRRDKQAGQLFLSYHARWALAGAALVFAVFGLGIAALRRGRIATIAIGAAMSVIYVSYFAQLGELELSILSNEPLSFALVWLPNVLITLTSVACLSVRNDRQSAISST